MRVATRAREVRAPDLRGQAVADARTAAGKLGLVLRLDEPRRPDPKVPADHVLSQDPAPGTVLRPQQAIRVRVSNGQRQPVVPAVAALQERSADIALAADEVEVGYRAEIRSPDYETGIVVSQDPPAKTHAATVNLLVNRGDASVRYVMPDLIGTLGARATDVLRAQGFRIAVTGEVPYPGLPPGIVVRQMPQAGFQIMTGEAITLEVSR
jgi:beta-lactam-binding protein with PASTA domain